MARYCEPHRRYHRVAHLDRVVSDVAELLGNIAVPEPSVVLMAAFFHDAIYDPRSPSNEADSAALASRELTHLGWSGDHIDEVERLILLTRNHAPSDVADPGGDVLLDADLAVLGAPPNAYQAYVAGVRAEYAHVDDGVWRVGRVQVLRRFIDQPRIYRTSAMSVHERRARSNLQAELATLRSDSHPD
jgi:predicted metal-dependent HD superfamily phosphohydrolase